MLAYKERKSGSLTNEKKSAGKSIAVGDTATAPTLRKRHGTAPRAGPVLHVNQRQIQMRKRRGERTVGGSDSGLGGTVSSNGEKASDWLTGGTSLELEELKRKMQEETEQWNLKGRPHTANGMLPGRKLARSCKDLETRVRTLSSARNRQVMRASTGQLPPRRRQSTSHSPSVQMSFGTSEEPGLNERDEAALLLGRMLMSGMSGKGAAEKSDGEEMVRSASRFFVDNWLKDIHPESNSEKASALSISLLARMDLAKTLVQAPPEVPSNADSVDQSSKHEDHTESQNGTERSKFGSRRLLAAVACEILDQLVAVEAQYQPILTELRAALYPAIFVEEPDPCPTQGMETQPGDGVDYKERKMWLDASDPKELQLLREERARLLEKTDAMDRRMLNLEEVLANQERGIKGKEADLRALTLKHMDLGQTNQNLVNKLSQLHDSVAADQRKYSEALEDRSRDKEYAVKKLEKRHKQDMEYEASKQANLMERIAELEKQLAEISNRYGVKDVEKVQQIELLRKQNLEMQNLNKSLKQDCNKLQNDLRTAQTELSLYIKKSTGLEGQLQETRTGYHALQMRMADLGAAGHDHITKKRYQSTLLAHSQEIEALKKRYEADLHATRARMAQKHTDEVKVLKQQMKEMREKMNKGIMSSLNFGSISQQASYELQQFSQEKEQELQKLREQLQQRDEEVQVLRDKEEVRIRDKMRAEMAAEQFHEECKAAQKDIEELRRKLDSARKLHSNEVQHQVQKQLSLVVTMRQIKEKFKNQKRELIKQAQFSQKRLLEVQEDVEKKDTELKEIQVHLRQLANSEINLRNTLEEVRTKTTDLQRHMETQTEFSTVFEETQTVITECNTVGSQTLELLDGMEFRDIEKYISSLRKSLKKSSEELAALREQNQALSGEKEKTEAELVKLIEENEEFQTKHDQLNQTFADANDELTELRQKVFDTSITESQAPSCRSVHTQTEEESKPHQVSRHQQANFVSVEETQFELLKDDLEELKSALEESEKHCEMLMSDCAKYAGEKGILNHRISELEAICQNLEQNLKKTDILGGQRLTRHSSSLREAIQQLNDRKKTADNFKSMLGGMKKLGWVNNQTNNEPVSGMKLLKGKSVKDLSDSQRNSVVMGIANLWSGAPVSVPKVSEEAEMAVSKKDSSSIETSTSDSLNTHSGKEKNPVEQKEDVSTVSSAEEKGSQFGTLIVDKMDGFAAAEKKENRQSSMSLDKEEDHVVEKRKSDNSQTLRRQARASRWASNLRDTVRTASFQEPSPDLTMVSSAQLPQTAQHSLRSYPGQCSGHSVESDDPECTPEKCGGRSQSLRNSSHPDGESTSPTISETKVLTTSTSDDKWLLEVDSLGDSAAPKQVTEAQKQDGTEGKKVPKTSKKSPKNLPKSRSNISKRSISTVVAIKRANTPKNRLQRKISSKTPKSTARSGQSSPKRSTSKGFFSPSSSPVDSPASFASKESSALVASNPQPISGVSSIEQNITQSPSQISSMPSQPETFLGLEPSDSPPTTTKERRGTVEVDTLLQHINHLKVVKEQRDQMDGLQKTLGKKSSKHTKQKMAGLLEKQEHLEKLIQDSGGWSALLYNHEGKCDLNFDLNPWPEEEQVEILKEMKMYLEREKENEMYTSAKEIRRLNDEIESLTKAIADRDERITELYQSLREAESKNLEPREVVTVPEPILMEPAEKKVVSNFMDDFDQFLLEIKELVEPEGDQREQETPEVDGQQQRNSLTAVSDFGIERRRVLSPMQYTTNVKKSKHGGLLQKHQNYSFYPKNLNASSLRKASVAQSPLKKPELPVVDIVQGKKGSMDRPQSSSQRTSQKSITEMFKDRREQMIDALCSVKGCLLVVQPGSKNNIKEILANKEYETRMINMNKKMMKHELLAKKIREDMEHQLIEDKQVEAEELERYLLETTTFQNYAPEPFLTWAETRKKSLMAIESVYGKKKRPHANPDLSQLEGFLQQAGYQNFTQRPGTAPIIHSPTAPK